MAASTTRGRNPMRTRGPPRVFTTAPQLATAQDVEDYLREQEAERKLKRRGKRGRQNSAPSQISEADNFDSQDKITVHGPKRQREDRDIIDLTDEEDKTPVVVADDTESDPDADDQPHYLPYGFKNAARRQMNRIKRLEQEARVRPALNSLRPDDLLAEQSSKRRGKLVKVVTAGGKPVWINACDIPELLLQEWESKHPEHKTAETANAYDVEERKHDPEKIARNEDFIAAVLRIETLTRQPARVLVLDGEDLNTTQRLVARGVRDIIIPNPFACRRLAKTLSNLKAESGGREATPFDNIRILAEPVSDTIEKQNPGEDSDRLSGVWLDYLGCWLGSDVKAVYPEEDIFRLFQRRLLRTPSILAITLSRRCPGHDAPVEEIINRITAMDPLYALTVLKTVKYRTMVFLMFQVDSVYEFLQRAQERASYRRR